MQYPHLSVSCNRHPCGVKLSVLHDDSMHVAVVSQQQGELELRHGLSDIVLDNKMECYAWYGPCLSTFCM